MLYFSLILSVVSLGCLFLFNRGKSDGVYRPVVVGLVCAVGPMCIFPAVFPGFLVSLFVGLFAVGLWKREWLPRYSAIPLMGISIFLGHLVPYLLVVRSDMRRYDEIREAIEILNPDDRLTRPAKPAIEAVPLLDDLDYLEVATQRLRKHNARELRFSRLHERQINQFVDNPGFGVARMILPLSEKEYYLPNREPIPQPYKIATSQSRTAIDHPTLSPVAKIHRLHQSSVVEFAFAFGWGWGRKPDEFLGFQPHQLGTRMKHEPPPVDDWSLTVEDEWKVASLELIGLLAHPKPTVYMTANLPRMDEAKTAPTRDPDEFETAGLKAIAKGQELYFGKSRTEPLLRMVGGLRAAKSCANCHGCREGELLGAFSYTLVK